MTWTSGGGNGKVQEKQGETDGTVQSRLATDIAKHKMRAEILLFDNINGIDIADRNKKHNFVRLQGAEDCLHCIDE